MSKGALYSIVQHCRQIRRIKCNACHGQIDMDGATLYMISHSLTELYLDDSQFCTLVPNAAEVAIGGSMAIKSLG